MQSRKKVVRGGYRARKPIRSSTGRFIDVLINKCHGVTLTAEACGVSPQEPNNWRVRGKVPVRKAKRVGEALKVSPLLLAFEDLSSVMDNKSSWTQLIINCKFLTVQEIEYILAGTLPKQ